jgi:hypothetical protein
LSKALAMLDAILSPEWEYRYYSCNGKWVRRSKGSIGSERLLRFFDGEPTRYQEFAVSAGGAEDVELAVAESGAHLFDVVDAGVVGVLAEVGRLARRSAQAFTCAGG